MKINPSKQKFYAKLRDKKFKTEYLFERWLGETATHTIHFKDNGQDCLSWDIDEGGEVLNSNLQGSVWIGMLVDLSRLKVGKEIGVMDTPNQQTKFYDFVVAKVMPYQK